jgi:DNA repair exonuclease SbcCD ATPase subunit
VNGRFLRFAALGGRSKRKSSACPGGPISPDPEQLRATLTSLEQELEREQARRREGQEAIVELEHRKAEAAGTVALAERAISELEYRLAEEREELARCERLNEAEQRLAACVRERDAAATEVADAVAQLLTRLDELIAARETVAAADDAVRMLAGRTAVPAAPAEPDALRESWDDLIERIHIELGGEFERDLIEAAARSPSGNAIKDLPSHLRVLATERRRALLDESRSRRDERDTMPGLPSSNP